MSVEKEEEFNTNPALEAPAESRYRAYQSNLLSLISHELRTPLMGILNALTALEELSNQTQMANEWIEVAKRNAFKLNQSLSTLLDLSSIDHGNTQSKLREIDFVSFFYSQRSHAEEIMKTFGYRLQTTAPDGSWEIDSVLIFGDSVRLARAIELSLDVVTQFANPRWPCLFYQKGSTLYFEFKMDPFAFSNWNQLWELGLYGRKTGGAIPLSYFSQVTQTEDLFLSRNREGLGSELVVLNQILDQHGGALKYEMKEEQEESLSVQVQLDLPKVSSENALGWLLRSRMQVALTGKASVVLVLMEPPNPDEGQEFRRVVKRHLLNPEDPILYPAGGKYLACILDDQAEVEADFLVERIQMETRMPFRYGSVSAPGEVNSADEMIMLCMAKLESHIQPPRP